MTNFADLPGNAPIGDDGISPTAAIARSKLAIAPMARAFHNANQNAVNGGALAFNSERFDTDVIHDTVTNNSRLTCKTAGVYAIFFNGEATEVGGTAATALAGLRVNGTTVIAKATSMDFGGSDTRLCQVHTQFLLAVNDYVEVIMATTGVGTARFNASNAYQCEFGMSLISRAV